MSLERREFLPVLEADNMVGLDRSADRDGGLLFFDRCFDGRPETGERGVNIADQRRQVGHADAVVRYMGRNNIGGERKSWLLKFARHHASPSFLTYTGGHGGENTLNRKNNH